MSKDPIEMFGPGGPGGSGGGDGGDPPEGPKVFKAKAPKKASMPGLPSLPFIKAKWFKISLLLFALFALGYGMFLQYVGPNEYGIKVNKMITPRGVQKEVYEAGLHFVLPWGLQEMKILPRDIQVLELTNAPQTAARYARVKQPAAHIQTSDGFFVDVDVSVLYHIEDPYKTLTTIGGGKLFEDNGIIPKTEPALKETLGELTTEEFYNSPLRVEKTYEAMDRLNNELAPKGLKVDQILIRYFSYSPEIQKNIEEKKLKDQLVFKNIAEGRAATEAAKFKKVTEEGEVKVKIKLAEGNAYVTKRRAERDLYVRKMRAKANLLIKLAEAKRTELRNQALQGQGSDRMVGLRMAETLNGLEVVILPSDGDKGVNPLDLTNTLDLFGVRKERSANLGGVQ